MALDFPDAPFPGQAYGQWVWDGIAWVSSRLGAGTYPVGGVLFGLADGNAGSDPDNLLFDPATGSLAVGGTLSLGTPLALASGGTGAITAADALSNLGGLAKAGGTMTGALQVTSNVSAFNYLIANQLTTDTGAFGFANTNGPVMVAWGNAAAGAGSLIFQTVSAGGVSVQAAIMDRSQNFQIFGPTATKP